MLGPCAKHALRSAEKGQLFLRREWNRESEMFPVLMRKSDHQVPRDTVEAKGQIFVQNVPRMHRCILKIVVCGIYDTFRPFILHLCMRFCMQTMIHACWIALTELTLKVWLNIAEVKLPWLSCRIDSKTQHPLWCIYSMCLVHVPSVVDGKVIRLNWKRSQMTASLLIQVPCKESSKNSNLDMNELQPHKVSSTLHLCPIWRCHVHVTTSQRNATGGRSAGQTSQNHVKRYEHDGFWRFSNRFSKVLRDYVKFPYETIEGRGCSSEIRDLFQNILLPSHRPNCHWCVWQDSSHEEVHGYEDCPGYAPLPKMSLFLPGTKHWDPVRQSSVDVEDWSNGRLTPLESCGYCGLVDRLAFSCRWKFCNVLSVVRDKVVKDRSLPVIGEDIGLTRQSFNCKRCKVMWKSVSRQTRFGVGMDKPGQDHLVRALNDWIWLQRPLLSGGLSIYLYIYIYKYNILIYIYDYILIYFILSHLISSAEV